jgi:two-component system, chemotaxis family, chemotaxis protein CheY
MADLGATVRADVLVIDDDKDVRETISQILEEEGYRVRTAIDGEDALERLRAEPLPRLVLLDLTMPVMDGRAFLARLRDESAFAQLPIVIISSGPDARRESAALGTAGYIAKPIELDHLLENVQRWVAR